MSNKFAYVLLGVLSTLIVVSLAFVGYLLLSQDHAPSKSSTRSGHNAEPGSGPNFKGKRSSDVGGEPGVPVSFQDIEFTASPIVRFDSSVQYNPDSLCTTVRIVNHSKAPFSVAPEEFSLSLPYGESHSANGLNDVVRLGEQTIPVGGSTEGSLCYGEPFIDEDFGKVTFAYKGDALGGTYIGWESTP